MDKDEVTVWLHALADGDANAAQLIWQRYCQQLVGLSSRKLGSGSRRVADEEDVAISAFHSFCRGVSNGVFPDLQDRHSLWKLIVTIVCRKVSRQRRYEHRQKRGGGQVRGESVFLNPADPLSNNGIAQVLGREPSPEVALEMAEQCQALLDLLDEDCKHVALCKLDGLTNLEISEKLDLAPRTVERKLARIREVWGHANDACAE